MHNAATTVPRPSDQLFSELQPRLWAMLTANLKISDALLEDACQHAWMLLLRFRESVAAGSELGWLLTTATRHALKLQRAQLEVETFDEGAQLYDLARYRRADSGPEAALEVRERLAEITVLPVRQRRLVWLQSLGYDYGEIAAATGESRRAVDRQLWQARKRLSEAQAAADQAGDCPSEAPPEPQSAAQAG